MSTGRQSRWRSSGLEEFSSKRQGHLPDGRARGSYPLKAPGGVAELVYATVSNTVGRKALRVRVPLPLLLIRKGRAERDQPASHESEYPLSSVPAARQTLVKAARNGRRLTRTPIRQSVSVAVESRGRTLSYHSSLAAASA